MTKIVKITDRLEHQKKKKQVTLYREKIQAIQRTVRCGSCHLKCAMCGRYLKEEEVSGALRSSGGDFSLCQSCSAEFEDFKKISRDPEAEHLFWQGEAWMKVWETWLSFQKALAEFRKSSEFKDLITEFDE